MKHVMARERWATAVHRRYRECWSDRRLWRTIGISLLVFFISVVANAYGELYATERASNAVTDIILSNTPVVDVDFPFVYGALLLIAFITILCLAHPRRIPFTLNSLSTFFFTRALFVSLTHLGPYPEHAVLDFQSKIILSTFGGGDYFFSAHTGIPFLMALVYWHQKKLRRLFLAWSVFFAVIVLLGHLHYSIDVLSAYFITFTIFQIALWLFPKERQVFLQTELEADYTD